MKNVSLRLTTPVVLGTLAFTLLAGPAKADVTYSFDFGTAAAGTLTTGGPATDNGFFLITGFTLSSFTDMTLGPVPVSLAANSPGQFIPGAAYDPTTGAFLNHFGGSTYNNVGDIGNTGQGDSAAAGTINGQTAYVLGTAFALNSSLLQIQSATTLYVASGPLVITPLSSAVPEPSTYALLGVFGVAGLVAAWRRRRAG